MPKVYNYYHKDAPVHAVFVGRGSPFGNPFKIGLHGTRADVCTRHRDMVRADDNLRNRIKNELKGKDLVCFCKPSLCHADYLLEIANET